MVERQRVLDNDLASMGMKLKQGFETHAENLKDLLTQSCRAGMARLTDLEVKAEELEAELISQQDMEDRVNKLRSHFGSSHFLFERALCFSYVTSFCGCVLSKCLQPSYVVSHLFSWHERAMERMCQYLRYQPLFEYGFS